MNLQAIFFVDEWTGWVVGAKVNEGGAVYATTDGGETWVSQTTGAPNYLAGTYFIDAKTGWVVGDEVYATTDGGATWKAQDVELNGKLRGVSFVDANTGWVAGDGGAILKTTTGGFSR